MEVEFEEHSGYFGISLKPENQEETVRLVRLGLNKTAKVEIYVDAHQDGTLTTDIVVSKKKRETTDICK